MSETTVAPAAAPVTSGSGPDAPAPAPAAAAPAPFSSPTAAAPAPQSDAIPAAEGSLLSNLPSDAPAAEPASDTPAEPVAEAQPAAEPVPQPEVKPEPAVEAKPEPIAPPTYEPFTAPEGVKLDDAQVGTFTGMLGEFEQKIAADPAQAHAAIQDLGQKLVDFYGAEAKAVAERHAQLQAETWARTKEQWLTEFRNDPVIGKNRQETSLHRMGALLDLYGSHAGAERLGALRDVFTMTGAGDNPEVLRFVHWAASRLTETSRPVVPVVPRAPTMPKSRAERLYRNSNGGAA